MGLITVAAALCTGLVIGVALKYSATGGQVADAEGGRAAARTDSKDLAPVSLPTGPSITVSQPHWPITYAWTDDSGHSYRFTMERPGPGTVSEGVGDGSGAATGRIEFTIVATVTNTSSTPAPIPAVGVGQAWPKGSPICESNTLTAWDGVGSNTPEDEQARDYCAIDLKSITVAEPTTFMKPGEQVALPSTMADSPGVSRELPQAGSPERVALENPQIWFVAREDVGTPRPWTSCLFNYNNALFVAAANVELPCHEMPE